MPHGYCIECDARVTVVDGTCLLGHRIDPSTVSTKRGRRIAVLEGSSEPGAVAVLERRRPTLPDRSIAPRPARPVTERPATKPTPPRTGTQTDTSASVASRRSPVVSITDDGLNPTGEFVMQLWDQTRDAPPLEGWSSAAPLSTVPERNPVRWLSLALAAAALAAVVMAIGLIFGRAGSDADALAAAATDLAEVVLVFDSTAPDPDFADLDAMARSVLTAAEALEVGDPQRAVAIDAAGQGLEVERRLGEALSYQTGFVVFVGRPSLPTAVSEAEISDVSALYTEWITEFANVLESVPSDRAFADHRVVAEAFTDSAADLQTGYLDALRAGDAATASAQLQLLDEQVSQLQESMGAAVTATRRSAAGNLDDVADLLARLITEE